MIRHLDFKTKTGQQLCHKADRVKEKRNKVESRKVVKSSYVRA